MQKEQADQELKFKKRARRRLVGAIALVLLMVIVLPIVLKDRAISTPQEKVTITMPNEATPTVVNPSDFDSNVVPNETEKQAGQPAQTDAPGVASEEEPKVQKEVKAEPKPMAEVAEKPASSSKAQSSKPQEAKLAKPEKMEKQEKADANHKFSVQIGVFSDPTNVKQLQAKLSDLGYQSKTEKITTDKGEKIRLKTQAFADRNEAAIALQNIKDAGLTGMVISQ